MREINDGQNMDFSMLMIKIINRYKLSIGDYTGNAEDSMAHHNGMFFSTKDYDNDKNKKNCGNE